MHKIRAADKIKLSKFVLLNTINEIKSGFMADIEIALVTGCFDIVHIGHARLLELAADSADIVIVGINSDDYIRRSPHKIGGPYVNEISRATLVASFSSVDLVTIFDESTPQELIHKIRPSVLVMGKEYEPKYLQGTLPAMREIEGIGARVIFAGWEDTEGISSSAIAQQIRSL